MTEDAARAIERLRILLTHLIAHNAEHGDELRAYDRLLRAAAGPGAEALLDLAIRDLSAANASLAAIVEALAAAKRP